MVADKWCADQCDSVHLADQQYLISSSGVPCNAGIKRFATAIQHPGCSLHLLDVSFNWVGPEAVRPLVEAAAALPQPLTILRECSHDLWRVEAAKAAARAAAAADTAVAAAAEAAAAAAAAGSSWDPHQGCDQLSVQQHPAAATALGFANSSYHGGSAVTGWGGSSMRTFAGSLVRGAESPALSCGDGSTMQAGSAAVWLYNGLYRRSDCGPGEAWSPDSPPGQVDQAAEPEPAAADAGLVSTRLVFPKASDTDLAVGQHSSRGGAREGWDPAGSRRSGHGSSLSEGEECNGRLRTVDPRWLVSNGSSSNSIHALVGSGFGGAIQRSSSSLPGDLSGAVNVEAAFQAADLGGTAAADGTTPAGLSLAAAAGTPFSEAETADALGDPAQDHTAAATAAAAAAGEVDAAAACTSLISSPGSCSSDTTSNGCMQQEASFRYQFERSAEDVVSSPTRYDQQQQHQQQEQRRQHQQQLKGLLGSQEFTLSPPNPLFFSSSPLASPIAPRKPQAGVFDGPPILFSLQPRPGAAAGAGSVTDAAATTTGRAAGASDIQSAAAATTAVEPQRQAEPPTACGRPADRPSNAVAAKGAAVDSAAAAPAFSIQRPAAVVQRNQRPGGSGVRAVMQLRQPFSPDRQLAAPSMRAMPPGSPRRRCGLNSPAPAAAAVAAAALGTGVDAAAAGGAACVAISGHPAELLYARRAEAACMADACSPAKSACSDRSCGSIGSSQSPARFGSSPTKLARRRVSQENPHIQQQQQLAGGLAAGSNAAANCWLQHAATAVQEGQDADTVLADMPFMLKTQQWQLEQQQQRHCARQLFEEGLLVQGCEVKAVASSGSYWCNLMAVAEGWGNGADGIVCSTHVDAVPLVGG